MRPFIIALCVCLSAGSLRAQFIVNTGMEINNSAFVTTNGDWTNDASARILNNGVIFTYGNFINNGVLDPLGTGGFTLRSNQPLTFQPGGNKVGYLTKEQSGTLTVIGSVFIKDSLRIKSGMLALQNPTDTIGMLAGAELYAETGSWIEGGFVARSGTGDLVFPLGTAGLYLPLKIYKLQASGNVTVQLLDAPAANTAGPGVDAMIGFPYAWQVTKEHAADTAAYIEINYPSGLPAVSNPIVVREVPGQQYASMGARLIQDSGSQITVKSYSRRLRGLFTVAQGFPSDPVTDSLALVALYKETDGDNWVSKTNWRSGTIDTWFGVEVNGQSITAVELPANNLRGPVADQLVDILSLQRVNLSANEITQLPDFTLNPEITSLNISDNKLDFASLEPNAGVAGINYLVQSDIGTPVDTQIPVGTSHTFSLPAQGNSSVYQWKRNGEIVPGATSATYELPAITRETMGQYTADVTNPLLPGLIIKSTTQKVLAYATVAGKLYAETDVPAEQGELTLFKVQPGAFDPVATVGVGADGSYSFTQVILDDYQLRGFADTLLYTRAIPTYYDNSIFWEEADTLKLIDNIDTLDIVSQVKPGPSSGRGSISGYLQEDDGTGRTMDTEKNKRVARAGVSARRVERTGRTQGEILTLVAYVFTDDNGEFTLPNLPKGEYRLNFQYPGYPMDESSYTTIFIGDALESQIMVEANVLNKKINVRKLIITGLSEGESYHTEVYPNPAVDQIRLLFPGAVAGRSINLISMQGKTLRSIDADEKDVLVNLRGFQKGMYILQIHENGRKVKTLKIAIE